MDKKRSFITSENETSTIAKIRKCKEHNLFSGVSIYILPTGIGSPRCKLFQSQITKNGGLWNTTAREGTSYVIVDESQTWDRVCKLLQWNDKRVPFENLKVVTTEWLSTCLQEKQVVDSSRYEIFRDLYQRSQDPDPVPLVKVVENSQPTSRKDDILQVSDNDNTTEKFSPLSSNLRGKWACAHPSSEMTVNLNEHITRELQMLAETYKITKDHWRAMTYEKAITILKNYPKEITTIEEAKSIRGIGESLSEKIWEIIVSGNLRKNEEFKADDELQAIGLFTKIWGAGPTTAAAWVKQGFRTLEDLTKRGKLTRHQQIGLKYFDDLLEKMPREEAEKIIETVTEAALSLEPTLEVIGCGSYRRLKSSCGDVDVLITNEEGKPRFSFLGRLISSLHESGFLTDDLVGSAEIGAENKYMGICKVPGEMQKHRRIDIFVVPREEFACALLAYTGSGHFNRSMRLLARKKGMSLSHHSLNDGVIGKGEEKIHRGHPLPTPTEKSIFDHLGLEYRTPEERDH